MEYGKLLSEDCRAVHVEIEAEESNKLKEQWRDLIQGSDQSIPLVVLASPFRSVVRPLKRYIGAIHKKRANGFVTLIIPEAVPEKAWQQLLHGQIGFHLKLAFLSRSDVIVSNVRYRLQRTTADSTPPK